MTFGTLEQGRAGREAVSPDQCDGRAEIYLTLKAVILSQYVETPSENRAFDLNVEMEENSGAEQSFRGRGQLKTQHSRLKTTSNIARGGDNNE